MPCHLLVVPNVWGVESIGAMKDAGAIVLDDLLDVGFAGVFFRRLRIQAVLEASKRDLYYGLRHKYLLELLKGVSFATRELLFVGTHPTDADLVDYDSVHVAKFSEPSLRELSKLVYGDAVMLPVEYSAVNEVLSASVDAWDLVRSWSDLSLLILREFPHVTTLSVQPSFSMQKRILAKLSSVDDLPLVWMEDEIRLDFPVGRGFLVADYDYLGAVRPVWRDAVVRCLGRAPSVERVFRLPWFVVDVQAFCALSFRADINGLPAVSMRGESLVSFVRNRLTSVFTSRELVGTWIGSLLSDDVTAVETAACLGVVPIASVSVAEKVDAAATDIQRVPLEFAWMYDAVPSTRAEIWPGPRLVSGLPSVGVIPEGWAPTLRLAAVFQQYSQSDEAIAAVVQVMCRLHGIAVADVVIRRMEDMAHRVLLDGSGFDPGDIPYMAILPGYGYLSVIPTGLRIVAAQVIGAFPGQQRLISQLPLGPDCCEVIPVELWAESVRASVYSGVPVAMHSTHLQMEFDGRMLGSGDEPVPGLCYLNLFATQYWSDVQSLLGYYPKLQDVMNQPEHMRVSDWLSRIHIHVSPVTLPVPRSKRASIAHLTFEPGGQLLLDFVGDGSDHSANSIRVGTAVQLDTSQSPVLFEDRLRRPCSNCGLIVDIIGHKMICTGSSNDHRWSDIRKRAWYNGITHHLDVQLAARFAGLLHQHYDAYVQAYVSDQALIEYMRRDDVDVQVSGNRADVLSFKSRYEHSFRLIYLERVFGADVRNGILRQWRPPVLSTLNHE